MELLNGIFTLFRGDRSTAKKPVDTSVTPRTHGRFVSLGANPLNVATVYSCIDLLSDSVANLPMHYKKLKGGIFEDDLSDRMHYLLNVQPCNDMNAFDFWKTLVIHLHVKGNAYVLPIWDYVNPGLLELRLLDPAQVNHDKTTGMYTVSNAGSAINGVYAEEEIIHVKNFSLDGKIGISTLEYARITLDIASSGDGETLKRFENGGNSKGIISNDTSVRGFGEYQDTELEKTAVDIDAKFKGGANTVSLPGQVQYHQLSMSSSDMQFLESRKFTVRDICRFFRVHPSFVFDDTSNNYKSAENASTAFLSTTLNPLLRKIEVEFLRKLVSAELSHKRKFEFNREALYAMDLAGKVSYQSQTIATGLYTVNEWRAKENKPPVEGGDRVLVSANLKGINEIITEAQSE
ncbi:phage portal protein [Porphyromonas cangingivalis]|uniref:phage portal protein n=1 Tax=Porphyromonas cangingivalis TaxID=36874 RepID=UPI00243105D3|nr:phage portal protein [Porphyromonas cangingivalis]